MTFRAPIEKYIYTTINTENPLWISFSGDSESIYDNSNVDAFTPEKPCVAGSMKFIPLVESPVHHIQCSISNVQC